MSEHKSYHLTHLEQLEAESIYVMREVAAQFERPALLFSGGKDSIIMVRLAQKAFWPAKLPFPLVHVDTGHNFDETIDFRDRLAKEVGSELIIGSVQAEIDAGRAKEETGPNPSRNRLQIPALLNTIEQHRFDACLGGARRDEEKARAKERFFSHRDSFGQWDPKNQRPELWNLFNGRMDFGENFRIFPISNWTEMDVWQYIKMEDIPLPSIYFSHSREFVRRDDVLLGRCEHITLLDGEKWESANVRCRTVGDVTCTGMVESVANNVDDIIEEVAAARQTERGGRADDKRGETAMEDRKKEGYF
ncbi:MAG: sulfate adenylyltransferase subunit CysD [Verrucomicrobia bacterium]|nr:sulfate adenylyltransferase subunit CysD [Verrucomicrobiota bacterium]